MTPTGDDDPAGPARASGLRVGQVRGVTVTRWARVWAERLPGIPLDVPEVPADAVRAALDAGQLDACLARLPVPAEGLHVIRLYEETPVVVAAKDHPVAAFESLTLADLAGELELSPDDPDALDLVAGGAGVLRVPQSVARSTGRRDLVWRPVSDAEPTTIALVWPADDPHPLVAEFIGIVRGRSATSSRTGRERAASGSDGAARAGSDGAARSGSDGAARDGSSARSGGRVSAAGRGRRRRPPRAPR